jgi:hypothetical protein
MVLFGAGMLLLIVALAGRPRVDAQDDKPPGEAGKPFAGKVLAVYSKGDPGAPAYVIEDASLVEISGQKFLVGTSIKGGDEGDWIAELKTNVAFEGIYAIIEFDSVDDYKERISSLDPRAGL